MISIGPLPVENPFPGGGLADASNCRPSRRLLDTHGGGRSAGGLSIL